MFAADLTGMLFASLPRSRRRGASAYIVYGAGNRGPISHAVLNRPVRSADEYYLVWLNKRDA